MSNETDYRELSENLMSDILKHLMLSNVLKTMELEYTKALKKEEAEEIYYYMIAELSRSKHAKIIHPQSIAIFPEKIRKGVEDKNDKRNRLSKKGIVEMTKDPEKYFKKQLKNFKKPKDK